MNDLTLEDAINLAGGPVTEENYPAIMPIDQLYETYSTLRSIASHFEHICAKMQLQYFVTIALIMSPSFSCRVRTISNGFVIFLPLGFIERIRVFSLLLLGYWGKEKPFRFIRSILDKGPADAEAIPPNLRPIFLDDFDSEELWQQLNILDKSLDCHFDEKVRKLFQEDVKELVHLSIVYILSHEFAHVIYGHLDLLKHSQTKNVGLSNTEISRGIETDADIGATQISLQILTGDCHRAKKERKPVKLELGCLRLAYTVTMLFAMTDTHKKYLGTYDESAYNHPMVRCELFHYVAEHSINADKNTLNP